MPHHLFVPTFRIDECLAEIRLCLERGWTGLGFKTVEFETAWKDYTGLAHAHFMGSNTAGLHLALEVLRRRLGWAAGDEVITTPITFVSTNHAILHAGLVPVFADVDDSLCLDPDSVRLRITPRTRAVMFVGLGGNAGRYAEIVALCRERGLALVLDAAHMAGTRRGGVHVGCEADAAVFSFQAVKNLPTADSGMLCFAAAEDDTLARKLSWLGINKDTYTRTISQEAYKWLYDVEDVGWKYHGNSIMAAIGLVQLRYLDADNAVRRRLAAGYREELAGAEGVRLIAGADDPESATHLFQVRVARRDEVIVALNRDDVFPGVHYRDNTEYRMYAHARGSCPRAAAASAEILSLPLHLRLSREDVATVRRSAAPFRALMAAQGRAPLLIADGDIATTRIVAGVLRAGFGDVEVRTLDGLFGTDVADRPVLLCRTCHPAYSWLPGYLAERGVRYAYFLDDNFWELTPEIDPHVASFFGHPATIASLDRFIRGAAATIVWAPRLGRYIADRFPGARVDVLHAAFDVEYVVPLLERAATRPGKPPGVVRIGYPTTRRPGVAALIVPPIRRIAARHGGRVEFEFVGWMPDALSEAPHVTLHPPIGDYQGFLEYKISRQWDIGLAPMTGGLFEACKTNNKYREYGGCRVAGIYSATSPYVECVRHGETGLLVANEPDAWTAALEALIEAPPLRAAIADRAFEDVRRNYNLPSSARQLHEVLVRLAD